MKPKSYQVVRANKEKIEKIVSHHNDVEIAKSIVEKLNKTLPSHERFVYAVYDVEKETIISFKD